MPSEEPTWLADDFWLAAHDGVGRNPKPRISDWPRWVGLGTGLLAELVHGEFVELRDGELFLMPVKPPDDPALHPLLTLMRAEEKRRQATPTTQQPARTRARVRNGHGQPSTARDDWNAPWPPAPGENHHRQPGHDLGRWMSFLASKGRAEQLVTARLSRTGLVQVEKHRRIFGGTTVRHVPYDSIVTANPANAICGCVQAHLRLSKRELFLAGLFFATSLHHHALAILTPRHRQELLERIGTGLDTTSKELIRAATDAVAARTAMR